MENIVKITKNQLSRIIKEELQRVISEHQDPWDDFDRLHDQQKDEPDIYGTSTLSPKLTARAEEREGERHSMWDDDIEVSTCCGAQRYDDHDLCIDCGEHADFEYEGAWKRGENESL